jgi:hypothetical protein
MNQPLEKKAGMATASVTMRIDGQLHQRLSKAAEDRRQSEADIVREALESYLSKPNHDASEESRYELAVRNKIIGVSNGLPADLSRSVKIPDRENARQFRRVRPADHPPMGDAKRSAGWTLLPRLL